MSVTRTTLLTMKIRLLLAALAASTLATLSQAAVETYTIDPVHSSVAFNIRHFVSKVPGKFSKFSGNIT
ncbi:MAG TPA: YceI family protein, partial [Opitutaceae bacterium]|nr:YceI family protein [Opitutaceae bacterium]